MKKCNHGVNLTEEEKYEKLLVVVRDIAEGVCGTGEDAVAYSNWCKEVLKEVGL